MAISRIGGGVNSAINAGSVTVNLPGSMAADDLIIVAWSCGDDDFTQPTLAMTTSGYTELTTTTLSADGGTAGDGNLAVFYKYHNGSDTNVVTAASGTGTDSSNAVAVQVFRGVALLADGGPLEIAIQVNSGTTGGDADPPQVSTFTESTSWVVIAGATSCVSGTDPIPTAPANYTVNAQLTSSGAETFRAGVGLAYRSGASDPENPAVFSSASTGAWCAATLVLKEAPAVTNANVTTAVVNSTTAVATPAVTAGATKVTDVVNATTAIATPAISTGALAVPGVVNATTSIDTPVVSAGTDAVITTTTVSGTTAVATPTVAAGALTTPTTVSATTAVDTPAVSAGATPTLATVSAVTATTSIPTPAASAGASVTTSLVSGTTTVPTPAVTATVVSTGKQYSEWGRQRMIKKGTGGWKIVTRPTSRGRRGV
jgi:hypothetical protein